MASSTVTVSGWTALGSGSMIVEATNICGLWLKDASSRPAADVLRGDIYIEAGAKLLLNPTATLYALPGGDAVSALAGVAPQAASANITLEGGVTIDNGTAITGATMPAGGVGPLGWLSAIWTKLSGTLAISASALPLPSGASTSAKQDDLKAAIAGLSIPIHDYIGLGYTGSNVTTVTYKTGGSSGTTVATLTLGYDGSNNLTSITKA